jgi:PEP-CTERM motif-containing protein
MKSIATIAVIGLVTAVSMRGDIIPNFAGTTPGSGTNTVWNYTIDITSDQQVTAGDFFTIYDFGPFITGSNLQPTGWTFSSSLVTTPPPGTIPPDDPTLQNLTWTYTGSTTIPTNTHLGTFSVTTATSIFQQAPSTRSGFFAATATRVTGGGTKINNVGRLPVPVLVPEPTTLSLIALAAAGSAVRAIRRRR